MLVLPSVLPRDRERARTSLDERKTSVRGLNHMSCDAWSFVMSMHIIVGSRIGGRLSAARRPGRCIAART